MLVVLSAVAAAQSAAAQKSREAAKEYNTQQHPPSLNLDIPTALLRPCLFDSEATDDAALPIHRHSYKRQATCKKGTEYGARAEGALVSCVHPACRAIGYLQSICSRESVYAARLPAPQYAVSGTMVDRSRPLVPGWYNCVVNFRMRHPYVYT